MKARGHGRTGVVLGRPPASTGAPRRPPKAAPGPLYLRVNADEPQSATAGEECADATKACTLPVSEAAPAAEAGEAAQFWTADPSGSEAIFSILEAHWRATSTDTSSASEAATLIAEETEGVMGASEDLSRLYFVSKKNLAPAGARRPGQPNLYLDEEGAKAFVGTLAGEDISRRAETAASRAPSPRSPAPHRPRQPRRAPLTFVSAAPLTGYDNRDAASGKADREVYLYHASAEGRAGNCSAPPATRAGRGRRGAI